MTVPFPVRKLCAVCGKPMKVVSDESQAGRERFVCTSCGDDPLHDPAACKWADSPLKPPAK